MHDDDTPYSGSRWEPDGRSTPDEPMREDTTEEPAAGSREPLAEATPPAATPPDTVAGPAGAELPRDHPLRHSLRRSLRHSLRHSLRSRAAMIGAAGALALVSGFGGFAIGNATAGAGGADVGGVPGGLSGGLSGRDADLPQPGLPGAPPRVGEGQQAPPGVGESDGQLQPPDLEGDGLGAPPGQQQTTPGDGSDGSDGDDGSDVSAT